MKTKPTNLTFRPEVSGNHRCKYTTIFNNCKRLSNLLKVFGLSWNVPKARDFNNPTLSRRAERPLRSVGITKAEPTACRKHATTSFSKDVACQRHVLKYTYSSFTNLKNAEKFFWSNNMSSLLLLVNQPPFYELII